MSLNNITPPYEFDPTGKQPGNLIVSEEHIITAVSFRDFHFIVPNISPFFEEGLVVEYRSPLDPTYRVLDKQIDYYCTHNFLEATLKCARPIYGSISFNDISLTGVIRIKYQTLGGIWTINKPQLSTLLANKIANPRITTWEKIVELPAKFPVIDHEFDLKDITGVIEVLKSLKGIEDAIYDKIIAGYTRDEINLLLAGKLDKTGVALDSQKLNGLDASKYELVQDSIDAFKSIDAMFLQAQTYFD